MLRYLDGETVNLDGMNILNQIIDEYPDAISFASGRPSDHFYDLLEWGNFVREFAEYFRGKTNNSSSLQETLSLLGQYGKTAGIINDLVSQMLCKDENISASPESIVITCGAQESMILCLLSLCRKPSDAVLICDPTYVGITGAAAITKTPIVSMSIENLQFSVSQVEHAVQDSEKKGLNVRAIYLVPSFDNPSGNVISKSERAALLAYCENKDIVILEDNPYGLFCYDHASVDNIKSLDNSDQVIYIGSFSKTLSPSVRVGFMALPNKPCLINLFVQAKSFVTLNTPQYNQAVVGGFLLKHDCSLKKAILPNINFYQCNRDRLLESFTKHFSDLTHLVSWNHPKGGFFITLELPFEFDAQMMRECAEEYGVIVVPFSCLSISDEWNRYVRFSFSYISPEKIDVGVQRFRHCIDAQLVSSAESIAQIGMSI